MVIYECAGLTARMPYHRKNTYNVQTINIYEVENKIKKGCISEFSARGISISPASLSTSISE